MRKPKRTDRPPIHGWRYFMADGKAEISGDSLPELKAKVRRYMKINKMDEPENLDALIDHYVCKQMPESRCEGSHEDGEARRVTLSQLCSAVRTYSEIFIQSAKNGSASVKVSENEANRRAEICSKCFHNTSNEGCWSCAVKDMMLHLVVNDNDKTRFDDVLYACDICGCPIKALVHLDADIVRKSEKTVREYPVWCWKNEVLNGNQ